MSNEPEKDPNNLRGVADMHQVFTMLMLDSELAVHRELIVALMAAGRQTTDPSEAAKQIHRMTAARANSQLAALADAYPGGATFFALLLDQWKKSRQI
jgi:hypothetical protein